jgi:hypothetical protein
LRTGSRSLSAMAELAEPLARLALFAQGVFMAVLVGNVIQNAGMFGRRHARKHRVLGLAYLCALLSGLWDVSRVLSGGAAELGFGERRVVFHVALGSLGVALTLSAASDFRSHEHVKQKASGTLEKHATVTVSEMLEHSFYQALNVVQIVILHVLGSGLASSRWVRAALALLATAPWLARGRFPVNSFRSNYEDVPLREYTAELALYRVKKWQYVFYKHALLHGLNISAATRAVGTPAVALTHQPLFLLYWVALNTSYTMEFFLQTLVKKGYMEQSTLLWLQRLLMLAASICATFVLTYVRPVVALASFALNMVHRGHDVVNTALVLAATLVWDGA